MRVFLVEELTSMSFWLCVGREYLPFKAITYRTEFDPIQILNFHLSDYSRAKSPFMTFPDRFGFTEIGTLPVYSKTITSTSAPLSTLLGRLVLG
jgi:hypothetical protein